MPDTSSHAAVGLVGRITEKHGAEWKARGYALETVDGGFDVTGDTGQFYLDAVANDANAVIAMAFLARFNRTVYLAYREEAAGDMIDLDESQDTFLQGKSLEAVLARP